MTYEATASFERELMENVSFTAEYTFRDQRNNFDTLGWNVARPYSAYNIPVVVNVPGPTGTGVTGQPITLYTYSPAYFGAAFTQDERENNPDGSDWYHGMEVGVTRRATSRGAFIVAYTLVKNHRYITNTFDTPNTLFFPIDETWVHGFTASGNYLLPYNIQLSAFLQNKTGVLGQRTVNFTGIPEIGSLTVPVEPYGSEYTGQINILDLRVGKRFSVGGGRHLQIDVNIYNFLNSSATTSATFLSGSAFGYATGVVPPRVARIGGTLTF
jgi:hypothetical protein